MATVLAARASSLASLRQAYCPPGGGSTLPTCSDRLDDDDAAWPVFAAHEPSSADVPRESDSDESLESEWDAVGARTDILRLEHKVNFGKIKATEDVSSAPINFKEVQAWLAEMCVAPDILQPMENRSSEDGRSASLIRKRAKSGEKQPRRAGKDLVFHLRAMPFDFNTPTHFRMLRTVYSKLTRNQWCPSIGNHWEVIGFQGGDPRTDLNRSGGVLNVLHLFFFVAQHLDLAKACFQLSQDEHQNFPLACISVNLTHLVIESLSAGRLSALCSKDSGDRGILEMTCKIHSASMAYFCSRWRSQKRTIEHTEQTRNEIKALLDRKPSKLLEELAQGAVAGGHSKKALSVPEFADLETITGGAVQALGSQGRGFWARSKAAVLPKRLRRYQDDENSAAWKGA